MARVGTWSASDAASFLATAAADDGPAMGWTSVGSSTWTGFVTGSLSALDVVDIVDVNLGVGQTYNFVGSGSSQITIDVYDSSGYLLQSVDGDTIGRSDAALGDSVYSFSASYSGLHYVAVSYEVAGGAGTWLLAGAQFGDALVEVWGTSGAETVTGSSSGDLIRALSGVDTVLAGAGNDLIYGNQGTDLIDGGDGNDTIFGGQNDGPAGSDGLMRSGTEGLFGGNGDDLIYGNFGNDQIFAQAGNDTVYGGQDDDAIAGSDGNDLMFGNLGNDSLLGGSGADTFAPGAGDDRIIDFTSEDFIMLSGSRTSMVQSGSDVVITTTTGTVTLVGVNLSSVTDSVFI